MKVKIGDRFLYKFGWFGSSFGGLTAWILGKKYECILNVEEKDGVLWFMDNGMYFGEVYPLEKEFIEKLIPITKELIIKHIKI